MWRNLFALEQLPLDPVRPAAPRRAWLRLLLAPEPLAREPEAPQRRRRARWLRMLLAPEPLAREPEAPPRRRRAGWLRMLLAPERIDPK